MIERVSVRLLRDVATSDGDCGPNFGRPTAVVGPGEALYLVAMGAAEFLDPTMKPKLVEQCGGVYSVERR